MLTLALLCAGLALVIYWRGTALTVTPAMLDGALRSESSPTLIDVRTGYEYARGHIPNAISIPLHVLLTRYDELAIAPDKPVVVYCGHGPRACIASFVLQLVGFEQVYVLKGQITGWRDAGLPLSS
ncbi:MAG: rhodanese-like domain-containing protein [Rhodothermales bacterium]